jgi:mono/diheme cytochrome c family protein
VYSNSVAVLTTAACASSADSTGKVGLIRKPTSRCFLFVLILIAIATLAGCEAEPRKSDAELGLTPQQARGRKVYDARCAECHYAYSSRNLRGPSMHGLFQKKFMTSGIPANDERVIDIIELGRAKMPGFQNKLSVDQIADLVAYLHTL